MTLMDRKAFVARYGGIYEHSPWVAEQAFDTDGPSSGDDLIRSLADCVDRADVDARLTLIRAHPDLAGKAAIAGELTADSSDEQRSAGIDACSAAEFERFRELNSAYKARFGFPFVMAVRDSDRQAILAAFAARLANDAETEFETAIREIHKIARLRLQALDDPGTGDT